MATNRLEAERILAWLRELLSGADGVNVRITVEEGSDGLSAVQILISGVPTKPLAGLSVRMSTPGGSPLL